MKARGTERAQHNGGNARRGSVMVEDSAPTFRPPGESLQAETLSPAGMLPGHIKAQTITLFRSNFEEIWWHACRKPA